MPSTPSVWAGLVPSLMVALLMAGCPAFSGVPGSGRAATEKRPVGAFSRVELSGAADVEASIGPVRSVEVTIDDNLLPLVETSVEGDTLRITSKKDYNSSLGLKVKIVAPSLDGFSVSGAANLHATGLDAKTFSLNISGTGNVELQGRAQTLEVHLSGAGKINASNLTAKDVKLNLSGAGNAQVCAMESLDAAVSGAGRVRYRGHPAEVRQNVSGVGSIEAE